MYSPDIDVFKNKEVIVCAGGLTFKDIVLINLGKQGLTIRDTKGKREGFIPYKSLDYIGEKPTAQPKGLVTLGK